MIFQYGFLLLCMFPWVSFNILSVETQPWIIFFSLIFFISKINRVKLIDLIILLIPCFVFILGLVYQDDFFLTIRASLSYFIFCLVFVCFGLIIRDDNLGICFLKKCNMVWLLMGFIQLIFGNSIVDFFLVTRTSEDRGVTSFAPEPTFFAIYLFFMNWVYLKLSEYRVNRGNIFLILLNSISILLVAKSSLGLLLLFLGFLFFFILNDHSLCKKIFTLILIVFSLFLGCFFILHFYSDARLANIINYLPFGFYDLIYQDASANERLKNIAFPYLGFIENSGLPGGFSSFKEMHDRLESHYSWLFWYGEGGDKILSMIGSVIYELGFFGIFILAVIFLSAKIRSNKSLLELILLVVVCMNAISVGFPLAAIILSLIMYRKEKFNV